MGCKLESITSQKHDPESGVVVALDGSEPRTGRKIQSVERALLMLEILAEADGEVRLNEIARKMDLNVSTCHSILNTMVDRGFVAKSSKDRSYFLGNKIVELSGSRMRQFDLTAIAMDALRQLNENTGETVHLAALQGDELVTLAQLDSRHVIRVVSGTGGKSEAVHATATGKSILAWLPESEVDRILMKTGMTRFTDKTITQRSELIEELRLVRRNGFAIDREEFQPGVVCIGAAIRNHAGAVIGSFSCSLPSMRGNDEELQSIELEVKAAARRISDNLGGVAHVEADDSSHHGTHK